MDRCVQRLYWIEMHNQGRRHKLIKGSPGADRPNGALIISGLKRHVAAREDAGTAIATACYNQVDQRAGRGVRPRDATGALAAPEFIDFSSNHLPILQSPGESAHASKSTEALSSALPIWDRARGFLQHAGPFGM
jgi:hypothetical protein